MLVVDVANKIIAAGLAFTPGGSAPSIHVNWHPDDPDEIVVVSDYTALPPTITMNGAGTPLVENPRLQVMVRHSPMEVVACYNRCRSIYNLLCSVVDMTLDNSLYTLIAVDSPSMIGRDEQQRVLYAVNFQVSAQQVD